MKKNYIFYLTLLAIPVVSFLFLGYSSGQTQQYSGSPGDNNQSCTVCHTPGTSHNAAVTINSDIPTAGYVPGQTYSVTVSVTSDASRQGFQITAENDSNDKVGTFAAGTGSQTGNSNHLVTHTTAGNTMNSWTFTWTAPNTDEGVVNFYAAANATNSDGNTTGDQVVLTSVSYNSTVGIADYNTLHFDLYPNPVNNFIYTDYEIQNSNCNYRILDIQGKLIQQNKYENNQKIDVSSLTKGVYFINIIDGNNKGVVRFMKK